MKKIKKFIFEQGGFLCQIPIVLAILILFPIFGENLDGVHATINAWFYIWGFLLCLLPIAEHFLYYKYWAVYLYNKPWIIVVCYVLMFALLVINMESFQVPMKF
jgi:hypothetical protein